MGANRLQIEVFIVPQDQVGDEREDHVIDLHRLFCFYELAERERERERARERETEVDKIIELGTEIVSQQ